MNTDHHIRMTEHKDGADLGLFMDLAKILTLPRTKI